MTPLVVGVPRELKDGEHRVAITPDGVHELRSHDVAVLVEQGAGAGSSISDADYRARRAPRSSRTRTTCGRAPGSSSRSRSPSPRSSTGCDPASCCSPTCTSRRIPKSPTCCSNDGVVGHRVRDGAAGVGRAPPARADERGRRPDGTAGGVALPRAGARRARRAARRRARRTARESRGDRRRQRGLERGVDRAGHGGRGAAASTATSTGCAGSTRSTRAGS